MKITTRNKKKPEAPKNWPHPASNPVKDDDVPTIFEELMEADFEEVLRRTVEGVDVNYIDFGDDASGFRVIYDTPLEPTHRTREQIRAAVESVVRSERVASHVTIHS